MMVMDFAEKYKCGFQTEPASAYFEQNMATIHLIMSYMKRKVYPEELVKPAIVCINSELKHDGNAVAVFENKPV